MALKTLLPILAALAVECVSAIDIRYVRSSRAPSTAPVDLPEADIVVNLTEKVPRPSFKKEMLRSLRGGGRDTTGSIAGSADDEEYLTDITVGGQHFKAIVDTGRSASLQYILA